MNASSGSFKMQFQIGTLARGTSNESSALSEIKSGCWSDSCGAVHALRADMHSFCPKGHKLIVRIAPVTEVPAFCNCCFKHIVQASWGGDVKFCAVAGCRFIVCASCLISLQSSAENGSYLDACVQRESVSSLKVRMHCHITGIVRCADYRVYDETVSNFHVSSGCSNFLASMVQTALGKSLLWLDYRRSCQCYISTKDICFPSNIL